MLIKHPFFVRKHQQALLDKETRICYNYDTKLLLYEVRI